MQRDKELEDWLKRVMGEEKVVWKVVELPCEPVDIEWTTWERIFLRDEFGNVWVSHDQGQTFTRESVWVDILLEARVELWWIAERWASRLWHWLGGDAATYWLDFLPAFFYRGRKNAERALYEHRNPDEGRLN